MSLSWRQRRLLRAIERELAERDPRLADHLSGPRVRRPATVADWFGRTMFSLALLFLVCGLVLVDRSLLRDALLLFSSLPPVVLVVARSGAG